MPINMEGWKATRRWSTYQRRPYYEICDANDRLKACLHRSHLSGYTFSMHTHDLWGSRVQDFIPLIEACDKENAI